MENLTQIPLNKLSKFFFHVKTSKIAHPEIFFNDTEVKTVNGHKHLGLTLDTKLMFASHIDEKLKKVPKGLAIITTLSLAICQYKLLTRFIKCMYDLILIFVTSSITFLVLLTV